MIPHRLIAILSGAFLAFGAHAQSPTDLGRALTFHASFDKDLNADFSKGDHIASVRKGKETVPALPNEEAKIVEGAGRYGGALRFPKKKNLSSAIQGHRCVELQ